MRWTSEMVACHGVHLASLAVRVGGTATCPFGVLD